MTKEELFEFMASGGIQQEQHLIPEDFYCLGVLEKVYPALVEDKEPDYWYRTWIWENDKGIRVAFWDQGNSWVDFMCEGTEEKLSAYFEAEDAKRELEKQ